MYRCHPGGGSIRYCRHVESSGFPDSERDKKILGYPIIGTDDDLPELVKIYPEFLITIGQISGAAARIGLFDRITELGGHFR